MQRLSRDLNRSSVNRRELRPLQATLQALQRELALICRVLRLDWAGFRMAAFSGFRPRTKPSPGRASELQVCGAVVTKRGGPGHRAFENNRQKPDPQRGFNLKREGGRTADPNTITDLIYVDAPSTTERRPLAGYV